MRYDCVLAWSLHRCTDILDWSGSLVTGRSAFDNSPLGTRITGDAVLEQPTEPRTLSFIDELFELLYSFLHFLTRIPLGL